MTVNYVFSGKQTRCKKNSISQNEEDNSYNYVNVWPLINFKEVINKQMLDRLENNEAKKTQLGPVKMAPLDDTHTIMFVA